jgi:hypothetical protein
VNGLRGSRSQKTWTARCRRNTAERAVATAWLIAPGTVKNVAHSMTRQIGTWTATNPFSARGSGMRSSPQKIRHSFSLTASSWWARRRQRARRKNGRSIRGG